MVLAASPGPVADLGVSPAMSFACARYANGGEVWCAGEGTVGQLGFGKDMLDDETLQPGVFWPPKKVMHVRFAEAIGVGLHSACALAGGSVWCWGLGGNGELGGGNFQASGTPQVVVGVRDATSLGVGDSHACAIVKDGHVKCWGQGREGQLGDGSNEKQNVPVDVVGVKGAKQLAISGVRSCALDAKGAVWCWGPTPPAVVAGTGKVEEIAAAGNVTCARAGKTIKCWGARHGAAPTALSALSGKELIGVGGAVCTSTTCEAVPTCFVRKERAVQCANRGKLQAVAEKL